MGGLGGAGAALFYAHMFWKGSKSDGSRAQSFIFRPRLMAMTFILLLHAMTCMTHRLQSHMALEKGPGPVLESQRLKNPPMPSMPPMHFSDVKGRHKAQWH